MYLLIRKSQTSFGFSTPKYEEQRSVHAGRRADGSLPITLRFHDSKSNAAIPASHPRSTVVGWDGPSC
ncbi:MAG: hypothetical protein HXX11_13905 [Desulfuromonadales bacterium]|nr:hypothetical protein [Desulfuromonadales bacterium]